MNAERVSALQALDEFFSVIRSQADRDPQFALDLVRALRIPIKVEIEAAKVDKSLPFLDPVVIASQGYDEFRRVFRPLSDANLRKIIVSFGIAPKDRVSAKGPKGEELLAMLWDGAQVRRSQHT